MSRPAEPYCNYFPLDCNYYDNRDVRILRASLGSKFELVLLRLWCMIYSGKGYYVQFGPDDCALLAERMGEEFSAAYIGEVVSGCCARGIFDSAVFAAFGVLTGKGVQKRYLKIKARKDNVPVIKQYWVLDDLDYKETDNAKLKLQFFNVNADKIAVNVTEIKDNDAKTPTKGKESKGKKSKGNRTADIGDGIKAFKDFASNDERLYKSLVDFYDYRKKSGKPMTDIACARLCSALSKLADDANVQDRTGYMQASLDCSILHNWTGVFAPKDFADRPVNHMLPGSVDRPHIVRPGDDITEFL